MPENDGLRTNCGPSQRRSPNGSYGHFALTGQGKLAAEKRPPRLESCCPAKTTDEESIHSLTDSP